MAIETRDQATVITHALAQHTLSELRRYDTDAAAFRDGLVRLGRICGATLIDERFETESVAVRTPLTEATGEQIAGRESVVLVNVLRAATPFVEGLSRVFPEARQGVVSASRDEENQRPDGSFPVETEYAKLPEIGPSDRVIVADPMLATGSTLTAILEDVLERGDPEWLIALSAVSAPAGLDRLADAVPEAELVTVAVDDRLDDEGFIVPGLGDAGDRAFNTT